MSLSSVMTSPAANFTRLEARWRRWDKTRDLYFPSFGVDCGVAKYMTRPLKSQPGEELLNIFVVGSCSIRL